jgi:transketolase
MRSDSALQKGSACLRERRSTAAMLHSDTLSDQIAAAAFAPSLETLCLTRYSRRPNLTRDRSAHEIWKDSQVADAELSGSVALARRLRRHAVGMTQRSGASHLGSVLSIADILAVLYGGVLRVDPKRPQWPQRDRFVLSKGHAAAGLYAVLAERGFLPLEQLEHYYQNGSPLTGHTSDAVPGVEVSTGSLGHGFPLAAGMAYAAKLDAKDHRVLALLSDGECDEGATWEAALFAAHHRLDNLVAVIDYNKIQSLRPVSETLGLEPFADKWSSFGWAVREVDGHDHPALLRSFSEIPFEEDRPSCLIAHTVKGKGVSFMENTVLWHYRAPQGEEFRLALRELE